MVMRSVLIAASVILVSPTIAMAAPMEVGYTQGSLAVSDLIGGKLERAERTLAAQSAEDARDPARLINLGIVYARSGRVAQARTSFEAAMTVPDETLTLSDGNERSSRAFAREQLRRLNVPAIAFR